MAETKRILRLLPAFIIHSKHSPFLSDLIWFPDLPLITSYMVDQIWKKSASYTTDVN